MNIAMVMSSNRLEQEHGMLNRLVVGIVNDGNQVVRIIPTTQKNELAHYENAVSFAKRISTPMPVSRLLRKTRVESICQCLDKLDLNAIVAFGKDAEQIAIDMQQHIDAPILKEIVSMRDASKVKKSSPVWRWLAATPSMERMVASRVGEDRVALVPLGAATSHATIPLRTGTNRCVSILDAGSFPKATISVLETLKSEPELHIFLELTGHHQHKVWKHIQTLEMLDRVTCLRDVSVLRSLITHSDFVILPSPTMPVRTLLLEVMLASIPVIATRIPGFDMLIDEETAIITEGQWGDSIKKALHKPHYATRIGSAGASLVKEQYASSTQIAAFDASFTLI